MRELCLVLDELGKYRLVLKSGELSEIDEYTSKKFHNSEEIREKHKTEIEDFLKQHEEKIKNSNKPNYKGRICLVLPEKVGLKITDYQKSVLYKKHITIFNQLLNNRDAMCEFAYFEKNKEDKIVSNFICDIIRRPWNRKNATKHHINEWIKTIKKQPEIYYQVVRDLLTSYELLRNKKPYLKSQEEIYEDYIVNEQIKLEKRLKKRGNLKLQKDTKHKKVEENIEEVEEIIEENIEEPIEYYRNGDVVLTYDEFCLLDPEDIQDDFPFPHDVLGKRK